MSQRLHAPMCPDRCVPKVQGMDKIISVLEMLTTDESGVTAIEYGLLAALIAVAAIGAISATGDSLGAIYVKWTTAVIKAIT